MKNIPFEIDSEKTEAFLTSVDHNAYNRAVERARKMSGNGVTVSVIQEIGERLK